MKTSIIITNFNYGNYVERAIRSCLNQRLVAEGVEVVVVDDASTDHSRAALETYAREPRVRVIFHERNLGVAAAANTGIRAARGQFVVRVDADDFVGELFAFLLQTYLEMNHDAIGVACDYSLVDGDETTIRRCSAAAEPISCGIMYRKDALVAAGLYDADFRHCEEIELRRRMGDRYSVHHLRMPLYRYRMHATNKTRQADYAATRTRLERDAAR